jgi:hypothetical protein
MRLSSRDRGKAGSSGYRSGFVWPEPGSADPMQRKEGPAVTATMTFAGSDVHARSTHAAAIDVETGEMMRTRFGAGSEPVGRSVAGVTAARCGPVTRRVRQVAGSTGRPRPLASASRWSRRARRRSRRPDQDRPQGRRAARLAAASASTSRPASSPTWARLAPSTGWSPASERSTSGCPGSRSRANGRRRSRGCAASAAPRDRARAADSRTTRHPPTCGSLPSLRRGCRRRE